MPRCLFYDTEAVSKDRRIFDLVEAAYGAGERVVVFAADETRAAEIDRFLWVMKQESFIPHRIFQYAEAGAPEPVAIVTTELDPIGADQLIADGHCSLGFAARFAQVSEFVDRSTPKLLQACRARYKAWQDRGVTVEHVK